MVAINIFIYTVDFNTDTYNSIKDDIAYYIMLNFENKLVYPKDAINLPRVKIFKWATIVPCVCLIGEFFINKIKIPRTHIIANLMISLFFFAVVCNTKHGVFYDNLVWKTDSTFNYSVKFCTYSYFDNETNQI